MELISKLVASYKDAKAWLGLAHEYGHDTLESARCQRMAASCIGTSPPLTQLEELQVAGCQMPELATARAIALRIFTSELRSGTASEEIICGAMKCIDDLLALIEEVRRP